MNKRNLKKKTKNLLKLGFKKTEIKEILNLYANKSFNHNDIAIKKLYIKSIKLWNKFYNINYDISLKPNILNYIISYFKKKIILSKIFPIGGVKAICANNVFSIIGCVDLKQIVFINEGCKFGISNIYIDKSTQLAPNVTIGNFTNLDIVKYKSYINKHFKINKTIILKQIKHNIKIKEKPNKIVIGKDCWICASSKIYDGVVLCDEVICAIGSEVKSSIDKRGVYINNSYIKDCVDNGNYYNKVKKLNYPNLDLYKVEFEKHNLKLTKEYIRYIKGLPYNNINLAKLYLKTHNLVCEFNNHKTNENRRIEILDELFIHGENLKVIPPIYVDLLKTVQIGNNVTIKSGCYLGGVVEIEDDVTINEGVTIFATGHSLNKRLRKTHFDLKRGLINGGRSDRTIITRGKNVQKNTIIGPNKEV